MDVRAAVTPITHGCEVRRRCVDFVARHECGERLQLRVFPRKIQAAEADGWLGANAEKLAIQTKTSRRCAPGGTGGLTRPATKTARPSSQYDALIVVPARPNCRDAGHASTCDIYRGSVLCVATRCAITAARHSTRAWDEVAANLGAGAPLPSPGDWLRRKAAVRTAAQVLPSFA
jgi:hypothetical protein